LASAPVCVSIGSRSETTIGGENKVSSAKSVFGEESLADMIM